MDFETPHKFNNRISPNSIPRMFSNMIPRSPQGVWFSVKRWFLQPTYRGKDDFNFSKKWKKVGWKKMQKRKKTIPSCWYGLANLISCIQFGRRASDGIRRAGDEGQGPQKQFMSCLTVMDKNERKGLCETNSRKLSARQSNLRRTRVLDFLVLRVLYATVRCTK